MVEEGAPWAAAERRRAGLTLALDVAVLMLAFVVVVALAMPAAILAVRALQQHVTLDALRQLEPAELIRLIGADGTLAILLAQNLLFAGLPLWRAARSGQPALASVGVSRERLAQNIGAGLAVGVLVLICNLLIGATMLRLGVRQNQAEQYPLYAGDYLGQALFLLSAVALVPVGEEILFRGYFFQRLRAIWGGLRWGRAGAYIVSAALFAAAHSLAATEGVLGLLVPTFVMGLMLAWVAERSGSIVPSIVAHALNNAVALLTLLAVINGWVRIPEAG